MDFVFFLGKVSSIPRPRKSEFPVIIRNQGIVVKCLTVNTYCQRQCVHSPLAAAVGGLQNHPSFVRTTCGIRLTFLDLGQSPHPISGSTQSGLIQPENGKNLPHPDNRNGKVRGKPRGNGLISRNFCTSFKKNQFRKRCALTSRGWKARLCPFQKSNTSFQKNSV